MYGNGYVTDTVGGTATACGGQLLGITPTSGMTTAAGRWGCVLTITATTSTDLAQVALVGQSTRIVGMANATTGEFYAMAFPSGTIPASNGLVTFSINGVPFSGDGLRLQGKRHGDHCHRRHYGPCDRPAGIVSKLFEQPQSAGRGELRLHGRRLPTHAAGGEVYPAGVSTTQGTGTTVAAMNITQTLPSMHRPALLRYWAKQAYAAADFVTSPAALATAAQNISVDLKRAAILRPLPDDHPNFTGSNPTYQSVDQTVAANLYQSGFNPCWDGGVVLEPSSHLPLKTQPFSWDVHNAGTGVPDSVWVDLGMPVRSSSDGRLYKPLFAILCVDLDGRINLNAHGSLAQAAGGSPVAATGGAVSFAGGGVPTRGGLGLGPAEISPRRSWAAWAPTISSLLTGGSGYEGRYGHTGVPGTGTLGPIMSNKWFEYGQNPSNMTPRPSGAF